LDLSDLPVAVRTPALAIPHGNWTGRSLTINLFVHLHQLTADGKDLLLLRPASAALDMYRI